MFQTDDDEILEDLKDDCATIQSVRNSYKLDKDKQEKEHSNWDVKKTKLAKLQAQTAKSAANTRKVRIAALERDKLKLLKELERRTRPAKAKAAPSVVTYRPKRELRRRQRVLREKRKWERAAEIEGRSEIGEFQKGLEGSIEGGDRNGVGATANATGASGIGQTRSLKNNQNNSSTNQNANSFIPPHLRPKPKIGSIEAKLQMIEKEILKLKGASEKPGSTYTDDTYKASYEARKEKARQKRIARGLEEVGKQDLLNPEKKHYERIPKIKEIEKLSYWGYTGVGLTWAPNCTSEEDEGVTVPSVTVGGGGKLASKYGPDDGRAPNEIVRCRNQRVRAPYGGHVLCTSTNSGDPWNMSFGENVGLLAGRGGIQANDPLADNFLYERRHKDAYADFATSNRDKLSNPMLSGKDNREFKGAQGSKKNETKDLEQRERPILRKELRKQNRIDRQAEKWEYRMRLRRSLEGKGRDAIDIVSNIEKGKKCRRDERRIGELFSEKGLQRFPEFRRMAADARRRKRKNLLLEKLRDRRGSSTSSTGSSTSGRSRSSGSSKSSRSGGGSSVRSFSRSSAGGSVSLQARKKRKIKNRDSGKKTKKARRSTSRWDRNLEELDREIIERNVPTELEKINLDSITLNDDIIKYQKREVENNLERILYYIEYDDDNGNDEKKSLKVRRKSRRGRTTVRRSSSSRNRSLSSTRSSNRSNSSRRKTSRKKNKSNSASDPDASESPNSRRSRDHYKTNWVVVGRKSLESCLMLQNAENRRMNAVPTVIFSEDSSDPELVWVPKETLEGNPTEKSSSSKKSSDPYPEIQNRVQHQRSKNATATNELGVISLPYPDKTWRATSEKLIHAELGRGQHRYRDDIDDEVKEGIVEQKLMAGMAKTGLRSDAFFNAKSGIEELMILRKKLALRTLLAQKEKLKRRERVRELAKRKVVERKQKAFLKVMKKEYLESKKQAFLAKLADEQVQKKLAERGEMWLKRAERKRRNEKMRRVAEELIREKERKPSGRKAKSSRSLKKLQRNLKVSDRVLEAKFNQLVEAAASRNQRFSKLGGKQKMSTFTSSSSHRNLKQLKLMLNAKIAGLKAAKTFRRKKKSGRVQTLMKKAADARAKGLRVDGAGNVLVANADPEYTGKQGRIAGHRADVLERVNSADSSFAKVNAKAGNAPAGLEDRKISDSPPAAKKRRTDDSGASKPKEGTAAKSKKKAEQLGDDDTSPRAAKRRKLDDGSSADATDEAAAKVKSKKAKVVKSKRAPTLSPVSQLHALANAREAAKKFPAATPLTKVRFGGAVVFKTHENRTTGPSGQKFQRIHITAANQENTLTKIRRIASKTRSEGRKVAVKRILNGENMKGILKKEHAHDRNSSVIKRSTNQNISKEELTNANTAFNLISTAVNPNSAMMLAQEGEFSNIQLSTRKIQKLEEIKTANKLASAAFNAKTQQGSSASRKLEKLSSVARKLLSAKESRRETERKKRLAEKEDRRSERERKKIEENKFKLEEQLQALRVLDRYERVRFGNTGVQRNGLSPSQVVKERQHLAGIREQIKNGAWKHTEALAGEFGWRFRSTTAGRFEGRRNKKNVKRRPIHPILKKLQQEATTELIDAIDKVKNRQAMLNPETHNDQLVPIVRSRTGKNAGKSLKSAAPVKAARFKQLSTDRKREEKRVSFAEDGEHSRRHRRRRGKAKKAITIISRGPGMDPIVIAPEKREKIEDTAAKRAADSKLGERKSDSVILDRKMLRTSGGKTRILGLDSDTLSSGISTSDVSSPSEDSSEPEENIYTYPQLWQLGRDVGIKDPNRKLDEVNTRLKFARASLLPFQCDDDDHYRVGKLRTFQPVGNAQPIHREEWTEKEKLIDDEQYHIYKPILMEHAYEMQQALIRARVRIRQLDRVINGMPACLEERENILDAMPRCHEEIFQLALRHQSTIHLPTRYTTYLHGLYWAMKVRQEQQGSNQVSGIELLNSKGETTAYRHYDEKGAKTYSVNNVIGAGSKGLALWRNPVPFADADCRETETKIYNPTSGRLEIGWNTIRTGERAKMTDELRKIFPNSTTNLTRFTGIRYELLEQLKRIGVIKSFAGRPVGTSDAYNSFHFFPRKTKMDKLRWNLRRKMGQKEWIETWQAPKAADKLLGCDPHSNKLNIKTFLRSCDQVPTSFGDCRLLLEETIEQAGWEVLRKVSERAEQVMREREWDSEKDKEAFLKKVRAKALQGLDGYFFDSGEKTGLTDWTTERQKRWGPAKSKRMAASYEVIGNKYYRICCLRDKKKKGTKTNRRRRHFDRRFLRKKQAKLADDQKAWNRREEEQYERKPRGPKRVIKPREKQSQKSSEHNYDRLRTNTSIVTVSNKGKGMKWRNYFSKNRGTIGPTFGNSVGAGSAGLNLWNNLWGRRVKAGTQTPENDLNNSSSRVPEISKFDRVTEWDGKKKKFKHRDPDPAGFPQNIGLVFGQDTDTLRRLMEKATGMTLRTRTACVAESYRRAKKLCALKGHGTMSAKRATAAILGGERNADMSSALASRMILLGKNRKVARPVRKSIEMQKLHNWVVPSSGRSYQERVLQENMMGAWYSSGECQMEVVRRNTKKLREEDLEEEERKEKEKEDEEILTGGADKKAGKKQASSDSKSSSSSKNDDGLAMNFFRWFYGFSGEKHRLMRSKIAKLRKQEVRSRIQIGQAWLDREERLRKEVKAGKKSHDKSVRKKAKEAEEKLQKMKKSQTDFFTGGNPGLFRGMKQFKQTEADCFPLGFDKLPKGVDKLVKDAMTACEHNSRIKWKEYIARMRIGEQVSENIIANFKAAPPKPRPAGEAVTTVGGFQWATLEKTLGVNRDGNSPWEKKLPETLGLNMNAKLQAGETTPWRHDNEDSDSDFDKYDSDGENNHSRSSAFKSNYKNLRDKQEGVEAYKGDDFGVNCEKPKLFKPVETMLEEHRNETNPNKRIRKAKPIYVPPRTQINSHVPMTSLLACERTNPASVHRLFCSQKKSAPIWQGPVNYAHRLAKSRYAKFMPQNMKRHMLKAECLEKGWTRRHDCIKDNVSLNPELLKLARDPKFKEMKFQRHPFDYMCNNRKKYDPWVEKMDWSEMQEREREALKDKLRDILDGRKYWEEPMEAEMHKASDKYRHELEKQEEFRRKEKLGVNPYKTKEQLEAENEKQLKKDLEVAEKKGDKLLIAHAKDAIERRNREQKTKKKEFRDAEEIMLQLEGMDTNPWDIDNLSTESDSSEEDQVDKMKSLPAGMVRDIFGKKDPAKAEGDSDNSESSDATDTASQSAGGGSNAGGLTTSRSSVSHRRHRKKIQKSKAKIHEKAERLLSDSEPQKRFPEEAVGADGKPCAVGERVKNEPRDGIAREGNTIFRDYKKIQERVKSTLSAKDVRKKSTEKSSGSDSDTILLNEEIAKFTKNLQGKPLPADAVEQITEAALARKMSQKSTGKKSVTFAPDVKSDNTAAGKRKERLQKYGKTLLCKTSSSKSRKSSKNSSPKSSSGLSSLLQERLEQKVKESIHDAKGKQKYKKPKNLFAQHWTEELDCAGSKPEEDQWYAKLRENGESGTGMPTAKRGFNRARPELNHWSTGSESTGTESEGPGGGKSSSSSEAEIDASGRRKTQHQTQRRGYKLSAIDSDELDNITDDEEYVKKHKKSLSKGMRKKRNEYHIPGSSDSDEAEDVNEDVKVEGFVEGNGSANSASDSIHSNEGFSRMMKYYGDCPDTDVSDSEVEGDEGGKSAAGNAKKPGLGGDDASSDDYHDSDSDSGDSHNSGRRRNRTAGAKFGGGGYTSSDSDSEDLEDLEEWMKG